jgi:hypothetical protein
VGTFAKSPAARELRTHFHHPTKADRPGLLPIPEKKPGGTPGGGTTMKLDDWFKAKPHLTGVCRTCATPYLNTADEDGSLIDPSVPEGDILRGREPVTLILDEDDRHSFALGEWCSTECCWHELTLLADAMRADPAGKPSLTPPDAVSAPHP